MAILLGSLAFLAGLVLGHSLGLRSRRRLLTHLLAAAYERGWRSAVDCICAATNHAQEHEALTAHSAAVVRAVAKASLVGFPGVDTAAAVREMNDAIQGEPR